MNTTLIPLPVIQRPIMISGEGHILGFDAFSRWAISEEWIFCMIREHNIVLKLGILLIRLPVVKPSDTVSKDISYISQFSVPNSIV